MTPNVFYHQQSPTNYVGNTHQFTEEEFSHLYKDTLAQVKCIMAVVNQTAYNTMSMAFYKIKETPLFRHKNKVLFKQAMKAYDDYITRLHYGNCHSIKFFQADILTPEEIAEGKPQVTADQIFEWWLDIGSNAYKRSRNQIEMLRFQIYQALTYKQVPNYRVEISYVCLASSMLLYASQMYDRLMSELNSLHHLDFNRIYSDFSLRPVYDIWRKVAINLCTMPWDSQLPKYLCDNIERAYRAFEIAVMEDLNTAESANEAIIQNSDLLSEKDYQEYLHDYNESKEEYLASRR